MGSVVGREPWLIVWEEIESPTYVRGDSGVLPSTTRRGNRAMDVGCVEIGHVVATEYEIDIMDGCSHCQTVEVGEGYLLSHALYTNLLKTESPNRPRTATGGLWYLQPSMDAGALSTGLGTKS